MTDNELLLAISEIFDKKLKSELRAELRPIKEDIRELKEDVRVLKEDVRVLKEDVRELKEDVRILKEDVRELKERVQILEVDMQEVKGKIYVMENNVTKLNLTLENVALPRLDTIENCYTATYKRYQSYNDKMEAFFDDVDLLKKVVTEHSDKLQKIS